MADDTKKLRMLSLFSGIAGIDIALQPWCETVCYVEIDPYAVGVLVKNMGEGNIDISPIWDDIRTFGESELAAIGEIDIVAGGWPCTDISNAGKRAGIEGKQSGLWREMLRTIRLVRPQVVFLENVAALLGRGMGRVLGDLATCGYCVRWDCIPACFCGAHFIGDRAWIVASSPAANGARCLRGGTINKTQGLERWSRQQFERLLRTETQLAVPAGKYGRLSDGIPHRIHRLRCLGNAVVPQCARAAFECLIGQKSK